MISSRVGQDRRTGKSDSPPETTRQWVTGLVVLVTTMVCLYSFARFSIWTMVAVSGATLVGLLAFSWVIGERRRRLRR